MAVTLDAGKRNVISCVEELDVGYELEELRCLGSLSHARRLGGARITRLQVRSAIDLS
jgi:hypothetical protein